MSDPAWLYSVLTQAVASIIGFLITVATVIYQLDRSKRQKRTKLLRDDLRQLQNNYQLVIDTVLELIKQPYSDKITTNIPENSASNIQEIRKLAENNDSIGPRERSWLYANYISDLLDKISEDTDDSDLFLLTEEDLDELGKSAEIMRSLIHEVDNSLQDDIDKKSDEEVSVRTNIFDLEGNEYADLNQWFNKSFQNNSPKQALNGKNLLSISNVFKKLNRDIRLLSIKAEETNLNEGVDLTQILRPVLLVLALGVIAPILGLIELNLEISIPYVNVLIFQSFLLLTVSFLIFLIIIRLWGEFS